MKKLFASITEKIFRVYLMFFCRHYVSLSLAGVAIIYVLLSAASYLFPGFAFRPGNALMIILALLVLIGHSVFINIISSRYVTRLPSEPEAGFYFLILNEADRKTYGNKEYLLLNEVKKFWGKREVREVIFSYNSQESGKNNKLTATTEHPYKVGHNIKVQVPLSIQFSLRKSLPFFAPEIYETLVKNNPHRYPIRLSSHLIELFQKANADKDAKLKLQLQVEDYIDKKLSLVRFKDNYRHLLSYCETSPFLYTNSESITIGEPKII